MKKIFISLICFLLLAFVSFANGFIFVRGKPPAGGSATEDLTAYTKVDTNSRMTITADRVTVAAMPRTDDAYLYYDFGAGNIGTSFTHFLDTQCTDATDATGHTAIWTIGNSFGSYADLTDGFYIFWNSNSGTPKIELYELNDTPSQLDNSASNLSASTTYYLRITRSAGTITIKIYTTDVDRDNNSGSNLADTVEGTDATAATDTYRYFQAAASRDAAGTDNVDTWAEKYDLSP
jgi:hypothetical protein